MNQMLVEQYRQLHDAMRSNQLVLVELSEEPERPNALCVIRRENGQTVATPIATLLTGARSFVITPEHFQRFGPSRN